MDKLLNQRKINEIVEELQAGKPESIGKLIGIVDATTYRKMQQDHEQQTGALIAAASQDNPMFVIEMLKVLHEMTASQTAFDAAVGAALYAIVQRARDLEKIMIETAPEKLAERLFVYE